MNDLILVASARYLFDYTLELTFNDGLKAEIDFTDWINKYPFFKPPYRRDVSFKEDKVRKKSIKAGHIMASLNNLAIGVLRKTGWKNPAKARRFYNVQIDKALKLITNPIFS
jgi:hypothetical protein